MKTSILLLSQYSLYCRNNWKNVIFHQVEVVYFNEATNTSEYNFHDLFKTPKSKKTTTTNHPGGSGNNNEPHRTSTAACQPEHPNWALPCPDRAPSYPNQSNSLSTILGLPYISPMKSTKMPDQKEVIDLINSGSNDEATHLEDDEATHLEE
jgi:hypothetical protein